ncbi:MAG: hypothetical protein GX804_02340, partial [Lentisphaerae bacterium]|nr:hypothetical protein [Lentisphaerota bacterium]
YLKLDTQGSDLTWTPVPLQDPADQVLVDAKIFLVGSETPPAPSSFDNVAESPVQTAVYLRTDIDEEGDVENTVLCAYVNDPFEGNVWVELEGEDLEMENENWYDIRIELTYSETGSPKVRFIVEETVMTLKGDTQEQFDIANGSDFLQSASKKVNSVSFRGTGRVDNFVGTVVEAEMAASVDFSWATYTDGEEDAIANVAQAAVNTGSVGTPWTILFGEVADDEETTLSAVLVIKNENTVTNIYTASYDGTEWTFDPDDDTLGYDSNNWAISVTITPEEDDTDYVVQGWYGILPDFGDDDPGPEEPEDPAAPTIGGGLGAGEAAVAFEDVEDDEYFVVQFAAPEAGVTYSLESTADIGTPNWAAEDDPLASMTSVDEDDLITLKAPTDGATKKFFRVKAVTAEVN